MGDIKFIVYDIDEGHASICDTKVQAEAEAAALIDDGASAEDIRVYITVTPPKRIQTRITVDWERS